jgi:lipoyl(octanoyl) transferase
LSESNLNLVSITNIGRTRYADAWQLQQRLWELRHAHAMGDLLLFTEHEHVYTIGKGGDSDHLLASGNELKESGVDFFQIDRGGDVTYHGPGQIVGYPIIDLNKYDPDLHKYLRNLEEVIILALKKFGIEGTREEGYTGVWVKGNKIAAIGVKVSRWVTMHGFALNVNTDLTKFDRIIPCGIFHKGVTSMQTILGTPLVLEDVQNELSNAFGIVFNCQTQTVKSIDLMNEIAGIETQRQELMKGVS